MRYRHELKFIMSKNNALILKNKLKSIMSIDSNSNGEYVIRSLYFDDINNGAYYDKMDGVLNRKKYRIRIYDYSDSVIKLECKEKHNNMCLKRSVRINKDLALKLINCDFDSDEELIKEMKLSNLKPTIIVDYKRLAFTYPVSNVRVTFDRQISSGYNNFDLFDKCYNSVGMMDDEEVVMEVKYDDFLPHHIGLILSSVPSIRQAVSKFVICKEIRE